jgi:hypothetical protein
MMHRALKIVPLSSSSSTNFLSLADDSAGATFIDWHLIGQQGLLELKTKIKFRRIEKICNLITDQLILRNHNKNLSHEEWAIVADKMGEKYPIHFRDAYGTLCYLF